MKIEASHYDTVEWNPEPIAPGTFINDPQIERNCSTERKEIVLRSPCRIDVGLIDYSALKFTDSNDYKAGEMSFAGNEYTYVKVKLVDNSDITVNGDRPNLVKHYAMLIRECTDYKGGFDIETKAPPYNHVGFGSSAIIAETTVLAINELLGKPLNNREIRNLTAFNFVEESDNDSSKLFPGASTGGSFNTITNGGFVITSSNCEKIFREDIPEDMSFVIGVPDVGVKGPEASETDVNCMGWERHNERINAAKSCLWILTEVMPYWVAKDFKKVGEAFYNYTFFGGKSMQMLFYRNDLHGMLFELKEAGIEGGWMTSAGPSLVACTQNPEKLEIAKKIFKRRGCKQVIVVNGDNVGTTEVKKIK